GIADGSFAKFTSFYYALKEVVIHSDSPAVNAAKMQNVFPDFYKPTYRELFETIARQTKSHFRYDEKHALWLFEPVEAKLPYQLKRADGWQSEDRGSHVKYTPPTAPVGMDVY